MTVANLFAQHRAGKVSKEKFLYEVRRDAQLPYISNLTSYSDAIKILKQKGVIKEVAEIAEAESTWSKYNLDRRSIMDAPKKDVEAFLKDATREEIIGWLKWNDRHGQHTDEDRAAEGAAPLSKEDAAEIMMDMLDAGGGLKESKNIIKEQEDLYHQIDRLNPILVKKAVNMELAKLPMIDAAIYQKTTEKVVKKLQKDPRAYDEVLVTNAKEIHKADEKLKMTQVKGELKDPHNQMKSPKGLEKPKTNVKASKTENKKGKPKGVKEMKGSKKGHGGIKQMENPGTKETVLESLLSFMFKKKLNEDTHHEYGVGHGVQVPEGKGVIEGLVGDTATVAFEDGSKKDYQINALRYYAEEAKKPVEEKTPEVKKHEPTMDEKKEAVIKKVMEFLKKKKVKEVLSSQDIQGYKTGKTPGIPNVKSGSPDERMAKTAGITYTSYKSA